VYQLPSGISAELARDCSLPSTSLIIPLPLPREPNIGGSQIFWHPRDTKLPECAHAARHSRARSKIGKFRRDYAAKNLDFVPALLFVAGKIHSESLHLLWVMADMQTVQYFNLVGMKMTSSVSLFKCSRPGTFSNNSNAIGLAVAFASAIRTHVSVHGTAYPISCPVYRSLGPIFSRSKCVCGRVCVSVCVSHDT